MKWMRQGDCNCGQTCLAMILNKTVEAVSSEMNKYKYTQVSDLTNLLNKYDYKCSGKRICCKDLHKIPNNSILTVKRKGKNYWHWAVKVEDKVYDPKSGVYGLDQYLFQITNFESSYITSYLYFEKL